MEANRWRPEIVIGIDFGMTCTGVAYSMGPDWPEPRTLQHWPPLILNELANKVPTLLRYFPGSDHVKDWGFSCEGEESNTDDLVDCFKLHLDPEYADPRPNAPGVDQARKWFRDYLRSIHDHILEVFSISFPRWVHMPVEFVFSVPTTWKNPSMIAKIKELIGAAGFGWDGPVHRVEIGLTEAEAAAVYASRQHIEKDDIILVCDAGGGTTDVNTLIMRSGRGAPTDLFPLTWTEGSAIGSTLIDINFHRMVTDRLEKVREVLSDEPANIAHRMMHGRFERMKCRFGTPASLTIPTIPLKIPDMQPGFWSPENHIEDSSMIIDQDDLRNLFDPQVDRLLELVDEQLQRVERKKPEAQVAYLVLSGGLGSSPYVRQRLKAHFESGPGSSRPNAMRMLVVTVVEPQLAVVHGLVMDRIQFIGRGEEIFKERCCRNSYGVKCIQRYDPANPKHIGKPIFVDKTDGKKYIDGQIDWFVRQGESISNDGVMKPFSMRINPGTELNTWRTQIIMSTRDSDYLPNHVNEDGAQRLCQIESDLREKTVDLKMKNRHWYNLRQRYLRLKLNVQVIPGHADLRFQLQSKDGQILNHEYEAIKVIWEDNEKPALPPRAELSGGGIYEG